MPEEQQAQIQELKDKMTDKFEVRMGDWIKMSN